MEYGCHAVFHPSREHFFRPLTHENRELCAAVLRALHERVHGPNADYAEALTREVVVEGIGRLLADSAMRALAFMPGRSVSAEEERAYAGELLRKLKEHGWLEDYRDPIDLKPTLKLSRAGKSFSETFAELQLLADLLTDLDHRRAAGAQALRFGHLVNAFRSSASRASNALCSSASRAANAACCACNSALSAAGSSGSTAGRTRPHRAVSGLVSAAFCMPPLEGRFVSAYNSAHAIDLASAHLVCKTRKTGTARAASS